MTETVMDALIDTTISTTEFYIAKTYVHVRFVRAGTIYIDSCISSERRGYYNCGHNMSYI